jgi:hypothetical protein
VTRGLIVGKSVRLVVSATAYVAANEADPEVLGGSADAALIVWTVTVTAAERGKGVVLCVAADWAARTSPFLETGAVEDVLTEDGEKSRRFVHALETDGASGQLDEGWCGWGVWFYGK